MSSKYSRVPSAGESSLPSRAKQTKSSSSLGASKTTSVCKGFQSFISHMKKSFGSLKNSPTELYVNFFLHFCDSYSYFALSQILVVYLHSSFGASDLEAGAAYGMWGAAITFWGFVTGCFNDRLGIRRSLLLGFSISLVSNFTIAMATSKYVVLGVLFCLLPIGNCMGIPMLTVAVKRYTTRSNRGFAYGLYYSVMNIAALLSGPTVDFFNIVLPSSDPQAFLNGNRLVILSVTVSNLISLVTTYFFLRDVEQQEDSDEEEVGLGGEDDLDNGLEGDRRRLGSDTSINSNDDQVEMCLISPPGMLRQESEESAISLQDYNHVTEQLDRDRSHRQTQHLLPDDDNSSSVNTNGATFNVVHASNQGDCDIATDEHHSPHTTSTKEATGPSDKSLNGIVTGLLGSATFWRFCVFTLFLINLKMIFRHLDATLPTYLLRCFGPDYPKGMIYSINPFLIIWLTPTVAAMTSTWPHYDMIKYGGYFSALSPFFLAMSTSTWAVILFMVFLSLGEAIWSPRLYDYTMSIAPQGKEATFSALAAAPLFAAKIPVGLLSGYLLSHYLPDDSNNASSISSKERATKGQMLWLIVGLLTISSPFLITVCERCIREPDTQARNKKISGKVVRQNIDMLEETQGPMHSLPSVGGELSPSGETLVQRRHAALHVGPRNHHDIEECDLEHE